jgi:predicted MFS family arabinose efflux permease
MLVGLLAGGMLADRHDRRTLLAAAGLLANSLSPSG